MWPGARPGCGDAGPSAGTDAAVTPRTAAGGRVDLKLGHYRKDGIEVVTVLVGALKRVRPHDGWLDLVCTQERILNIFKITGLTKVFGIYQSVDQAIAARK